MLQFGFNSYADLLIISNLLFAYLNSVNSIDRFTLSLPTVDLKYILLITVLKNFFHM